MASIQQLDKGKWRAQVCKNGVRKTFRGKSKREVENKVRDWENDIDSFGRELSKINMNLSKVMYEHLFTNVKSSVSLGTFERYMSLYSTHVKDSEIGKINVKSILRSDLQKFLNSKSNKSKKSLIMLKFLLTQSFNYAISNHLIRINPMDGVKLPLSKYKPKDIEVLTLDEQSSYVKVASDSFYTMLFTVELNTGMRVGEIIALKWENVDLQNGLIKVRESSRLVKEYDDYGKGEDRLITKDPKTEAGKRDIPIHKDIINNLKKFKLKNGACEKDYVFVNTKGNQIKYDSIAKAHNLICEKAKIRNITFHCLRHTFATRLIEQGIDYKTVSLLLGHTDIKTTLNLYAHSTNDTKKDAIDRLYKATSTL